MLRRFRIVAICLVTLICALPRPSHAAADETLIVIGDSEVLRIRADSGGYTARQRADALRQRLLEIYQQIVTSNKPLAAEEVVLDMTPGKPSIRVRGILLVSVTQDDAKANGNSTVEDVAKVWHARLRDALMKNAPLSVSPQYPQQPGAGFP